MKKHCVLLFLLFAIATITRAQDAPPPAYLLKQDFPDSVKNLSMLKLDGSHVDFASVLKLHQGKKVIIDFWASWCRDCIIGLPKLEKLKQKTGDKVVYIFISVDEDDTKWRSAINRVVFQKIREAFDSAEVIDRHNFNIFSFPSQFKKRSSDSPKTVYSNSNFLHVEIIPLSWFVIYWNFC